MIGIILCNSLYWSHKKQTKPMTPEVFTIAPTQKQLDNLKKGADYRFTKENAAEMGRKGQIASVKAHKRNRDVYMMTRKMADASIQDGDLRQAILDLGMEDEDLVNAALIVKAVFDSAAAGNISAVDKWEQMLDRGANEETRALDREKVRALALMHANYLPNISSNFAAISVCALKHLYTHY